MNRLILAKGVDGVEESFALVSDESSVWETKVMWTLQWERWMGEDQNDPALYRDNQDVEVVVCARPSRQVGFR